MKKQILICTVVLLSFALMSARGAERNSADVSAEIEAFFVNFLSSRTACDNFSENYMTFFGGHSPEIRVRDITEKQAFVWDIWKRANLNFEEERLIPTTPITEGNAGQ